MALISSLAVSRRVNKAMREDTVIDEDCARTIASFFHDPRSALTPFSHGRDDYDIGSMIVETEWLLKQNWVKDDHSSTDMLFQLFCFLREM